MDIKAEFIFENNGWIKEHMDKFLTVPKWVLIVPAENTPNAPIYLPNLSAQAQTFWNSMKKGFIGRP